MGLLSLAIWTPIAFGVVLLAGQQPPTPAFTSAQAAAGRPR